MSAARVDVMAVLDAMPEPTGCGWQADAKRDEWREARAAVAELISAARDYADVIENGYDVTQTAPAKARLRAALARLTP